MKGLPEIFLGLGERATPLLVLPTWPSPYQHVTDHHWSTGEHHPKARLSAVDHRSSDCTP